MAKDDLARIHEELAKDGVFVHPSLRNLVSVADEDTLEQEVARADHPTYVVVWPLSESDTYGGKASDLLTRLHDEYPDPGIYLSTTSRLEPTDYTSVEVDGRQWGIPGQADGDLSEWAIEMVVDQEEHQDIPSAMGRTLELLAMDPDQVSELNDDLLAESSSARGDEPAVEGDSWISGGLVAALVAVVVVFVAWRVVVSFRKKPAPLPESAVRRIRAARARELLARARDESQALGEAIDVAEIEPGDDADSWQAALDHYAGVRRLLAPEEPGELDVVGALVLTARGREALGRARDGQPWHPTPACFLNPLHGPAGTGRRIEWQGRTLEVPVCDECRSALRKKESPDIFDVVHNGRQVHYFETDVEPWASTGFGSLETDLLARWHERR